MLHPAPARRRSHADDGATLIEVLVAIGILSIAAGAILAGLQMSVLASDIHRKQSTGGAYVRSYAEAIEKHLNTTTNYVKCAGAGAYSPAVVGFVEPENYVVTHSAAVPLAGNGTDAIGACPGADSGVQRIRLTIDSKDGRVTEKLTIVVRRSCETGTACD